MAHIDVHFAFEIISTIGPLLLAGCALKTWKKEHIGKKKLDLASEVIASFRIVEELLDDIRYDVIPVWEIAWITTEFSIKKQNERNIRFLAPHTRIIRNRKEIDEWYALRYRASVYWPGIEHKFLELNQIINKISKVSEATFKFALARHEHRDRYNQLRRGETTSELDDSGGVRFINNIPEENKDEIKRELESIQELTEIIKDNEKIIFKNPNLPDEISIEIKQTVEEVTHNKNVGKDIKSKLWYKLEVEK